MKYSVSNWIYGSEDLEKSVKRLSKLGYEGIEIMVKRDCYEIEEVKSVVRSYNLFVSSIAGRYPWTLEERDLSNINKQKRRIAVQYAKECIDYARFLEAPLCLIAPSPVGKLAPESTYEKEWECAVESVQETAEYAQKKQVTLTVEPINRYETYMVNNVDQGLRFLHAVNKTNVKLMVDCFHMNIEEPDISTSILKAKDNLIHIHIADSNRQAVGMGHIDFRTLTRTLRQINYEHYLTMEFVPPLPDPHLAIDYAHDSKTLDRYTKQCIEVLRIYENMT